MVSGLFMTKPVWTVNAVRHTRGLLLLYTCGHHVNLYVELSCTQLLFTIRFQTCLGNVETTRIKYIGIFYHWNNSGNEILAKNLFLFQTVSTQVSSKDRIHAMCCLSRMVQQGRTFRIGGGLYCSKDSFGQDTNAASLGSKLSDDHTRQ